MFKRNYFALYELLSNLDYANVPSINVSISIFRERNTSHWTFAQRKLVLFAKL